MGLFGHAKYSSGWMKNASDETLSIEREKVRQAYCSAGSDDNLATKLESILLRFDKEMNRRAWGDQKPVAPSYHTEHGHYLPEDDD